MAASQRELGAASRDVGQGGFAFTVTRCFTLHVDTSVFPRGRVVGLNTTERAAGGSYPRAVMDRPCGGSRGRVAGLGADRQRSGVSAW